MTKIRVNSYREYRGQAYPKIEEQLDMLWHAMDEGRAEKIEPWYSTIKAIKESHPKE